MYKQYNHKARRRMTAADAATFARTAIQITQARADEHRQALREAAQHRQLHQLRLRVARNQANAREVARLKALGVPDSDRRIQLIRLEMQARQNGVPV